VEKLDALVAEINARDEHAFALAMDVTDAKSGAISSESHARSWGGSIVNISSMIELRLMFGESVYVTFKAAVIQLTKAMAMELGAKGIRVNDFCPGFFETDMTEGISSHEKRLQIIANAPAKRIGDMPALDFPLLLLAGEGGSFMHGTTLAVDGGHTNSSL
jgi:NAD(P)-dependent dehydrogenase (short-subunit alcohol dehydrogenase family)